MIGVFDSGFGGLTILKYFLQDLPQYNYLYLGDNARAPYGNKSTEVIFDYTKEAVDFLFSKNCELIIIACNTVSAKALRRAQQQLLAKDNSSKRVLGVVIPIAEEAVQLSRFSRIGIIGTRATVESNVYKKELKELGVNSEIYQQACPLLVPLVEEDWLSSPITKKVLKKYLRPLKEKKIDTLILGCTHYPFLIKEIKRIMGKNCRVLNSPEIIAKKLKNYLLRHPEIEKRLSKDKKRLYYTTDDAARFMRFGSKFLDSEIKEAKKIKL